MSTKSFKSMAGVLTLAGAGLFLAVSLPAQPMYDRIHVNLPYTVTLQNKTLQPGDYTIQQLPNGGGDSRILLFYTKDGMKFETSAMSIPALDPDTARDTKVILNHVGDDYYISKIWVQGKDYGYELPVPEILKSRQTERVSQTTVPGTYQPSASPEAGNSSAASTTTAAAVTPPAASTEPAAAANTPATTTTADSTSTTTPATTDAAQNTQPPAQPTAADNSADRAMPDQPPAPDRTTMPSTSAGWLTMLLSGTTLSGAGLMLRRKR
jgi:hypothetical protein